MTVTEKPLVITSEFCADIFFSSIHCSRQNGERNVSTEPRALKREDKKTGDSVPDGICLCNVHQMEAKSH